MEPFPSFPSCITLIKWLQLSVLLFLAVSVKMGVLSAWDRFESDDVHKAPNEEDVFVNVSFPSLSHCVFSR